MTAFSQNKRPGRAGPLRDDNLPTHSAGHPSVILHCFYFQYTLADVT